MGGKKQTLGYKYFMSLHMGIGRGPLNEIAEIRVGDVTALDEPICIAEGGQAVLINKPDLFGGEQKEGGIQGPMYVYNGARDQELQPEMQVNIFRLPSIAASLGGDVPSFRGVVSCWFDGLVAALNPYPKEWSFRVRRTTAGWYDDKCWYPIKATITLKGPDDKIIRAMNGAHILYEVNTNPEWGRGMPPEVIDESSYMAAANTLCNERFGLCIPWFRQESIREFIPIIIDHIGAIQYVSRVTGKLTLRLIRNDYDPDDIPHFTPDTGLLSVSDDDASGDSTSYNEIIITGFDPVRKEQISRRVQNLASIQANGEIISTTTDYKGLPTADLVARIAQRELAAQLPLRRLTVVLDRRGWRVEPGSVFKVSDPDRNISNLVLRAGQAQDGTLTDGRITVKAVQDVFSMPDTAFVTTEPPIWQKPSYDPVPSPETRLIEVNWRDFYRKSTAAERDAANATDGLSYIGTVAKDPPGVQTQGYDLYTRSGATAYAYQTTGGFTGWLTLNAAIGPLDPTLTVLENNRVNFMTEFVPGMVLLIGDEQISFETFDPDTGIATIKRGVADTIPAAHAANSTLWLVDDEIVSDGVEYQDGEEVDAKVLTRTSTGLLDIDDAVEQSIEVDQRIRRPYPPGDVQQDGVSIYLVRDATPEPTITWAHRDRLVQADAVVGHGEASVGPEAGTQYVLRVFGEDNSLLRTETISGVTWIYTSALQTADGAGNRVRVELESVRDGLSSHQHYDFIVTMSGSYRCEEEGDDRITETGDRRSVED